ncbi:RNA helicase [[Candida] zeylanoides]
MSGLSGRGKHRSRAANQWDEAGVGGAPATHAGANDTDGAFEGAATVGAEADGANANDAGAGADADADAPTATLRQESRARYLERRQESKLKEVEREIAEFDERVARRPVSEDETRQIERKRKVLALLRERDRLRQDATQAEYHLPEESLDRKRKAQVLGAREEGEGKRYDNQWEREQLARAQALGVRAPDELALPNQDKYDYVFDESQAVQFEREEALPGSEQAAAPAAAAAAPAAASAASAMKATRESLPVFRYRQQFLDLVEHHQVIVVVGETGSGKTTQLPQYLHEAGYARRGAARRIACTQPRRVAATSVAARVADEMGVRLGAEVGYSIRFEDRSGPATAIKYLTDGMLLREFLTDPELSQYGAVMIDEAHERTVSTEVLLSLLKEVMVVRPALRVIVASATINAQKFADFFGGAPVFKVPGRRFPVDIHFTKSPEANYLQAAVTTIFQIHTTTAIDSGDVLVFLTGQEEIETMQESLEEAALKLDAQRELLICPIYANLPSEQQRQIFDPAPPRCRKIVLATNIAETSITIDGVAYVVDPGYVKENVYNPATGMESLVVVPCSRASADQRAGRAGRVGPGKCFRLYTKWSFYHELEANPTPEILRVNLTSIVLLLLSIGVTDLVNGFEFMDPPSPNALIKAFELLYALGALNSQGGLTKTGRTMVAFPIDCMFAKTLISSAELGVTPQVMSIIAMLGESSSLFYRPKDKREAADRSRAAFCKQDVGDHLTLLQVWTAWCDTQYSVQWCQDNFVQYKTLKRAKEVREQLKRLCHQAGIADEGHSGDVSQIQRAITAGFFPHAARLSQMGDSYRTLKKNQVVHIHPSSSLFPQRPPPKLVLYHELVLTSKEYMRNCMVVEAQWLAEVAPHYFSAKDLEKRK